MAVSFKLNNADFPPLSFPIFSKSCFPVSVSILYVTACSSLSHNVSLSSKHHSNSTNELLPMVSGVLCGKLVPKQTHISSISFVYNLVFNISTKSSQFSTCTCVTL